MSSEIEKRIAGVKRLAIEEGFDLVGLLEDEAGGLCAWSDFEALRRAFEKRGEQLDQSLGQDYAWSKDKLDAEVLAAWEGK